MGKNRYQDIIHLSHHVSATRPQMDLIDRAAQFSPFAALTGYDAAIEESRRLTTSFVELDESQKIILDEKLQWIQKHLKENPKIIVTYFKPDSLKEGGEYIKITDVVKKIDFYEKCIIMTSGNNVPIKYIYEIESD